MRVALCSLVTADKWVIITTKFMVSKVCSLQCKMFVNKKIL